MVISDTCGCGMLVFELWPSWTRTGNWKKSRLVLVDHSALAHHEKQILNEHLWLWMSLKIIRKNRKENVSLSLA